MNPTSKIASRNGADLCHHQCRAETAIAVAEKADINMRTISDKRRCISPFEQKQEIFEYLLEKPDVNVPGAKKN